MHNYLKKELPTLKTEKEINLAKKYRRISKKLNHDIEKLVDVISDYSVYHLFETLNYIKLCKPSLDAYHKCWQRAVEDGNIEREKNSYRRKVYHFLKNSGYDDGYIEDNIEKFTDILISFYTNPENILNYLSLYNKENPKYKVKIRHIKK